MHDLLIFLALGLVGFIAGFVDAVAGGGGLLALPALMATGLPPNVAIGTLKLQSLFGTSAAAYGYFGRNMLSKIHQNWLAFCFTAIGAIGGTLLLTWISTEIMMLLVPLMLIGVAAFVLIHNPLSKAEDAKEVPVNRSVQALLGSIWGGYDGFFGPGTGMFWTLSLIRMGQQSLLSATGITKIMNMCSNVVSVTIFVTLGSVHLGFALVMGVGQVLGGLAGAHMGQHFQAKLIRPMVVIGSLAISAKLIWEQF